MAEQAKTTEYVVLVSDIVEAGAEVWTVLGTFHGSNDKQAIRAAIQAGANGAQYAAVPSRSWAPRKPVVDTTPTVKF